MADTPAPGRFYDIRPGDGGLLKTVGRAYGLEEGTRRLRAAQALNNHPLNRKFWRSPKNDFEHKHFPAGIIGFKPQYACGDTQAGVERGAKRCFARIWVPPPQAAYHSQLGHGISLPASALPSFLPTSLSSAAGPVPDVRNLFAPHICETLDAGCSTGLQPDEVCNIGADSRTRVEDTTLAPYRWTCHLHLFFREHPLSEVIWRFAGATGFLVGNDHVLTSAHAIHDHIFGPSKPAVSAVAAVVIPGRDGILEDLLNLSTYGAFLVNDRNAFKVPAEWKGCMREAGRCADEVQFDYALISLTTARQCDTIRPRLGTWPTGFWGADKTGTHIATQVRGFRLSTVSNLEVVAAGYPGDKPCTQWSSRGRMRRIRYRGTAAHNVMEHELYTAQGLSGAPVWGRVRIKGREQLVLVGIHSVCRRDNRTGRAIAGEATLITREVWRRIKAWMAT